MTIEYRYSRGDQPDADEGKLHGRAAPFNSWTLIGGDKWGFREKIAPGAFKKSIAERDIVLLDNHDTSKPLARTSAGTLELKEKRDGAKPGLHFDATPANTTYANDAVENVRAKNYGGMSFGFEVLHDSWKRGENGAPDERTLHEVRLHEISTVTFPAYGNTDVSARDSLAAAKESRDRALGTDERDGNKPYGNVTYADPKNGKYPIDTAAHAKAAWSYINMPKNAAKYPLNGVSLSSVKAKIKAACKKFGIETKAEFTSEDFRELALALTEEITDEMREIIDFALRSDDEPTDPYDDDFYERDAADGDPVAVKNKNGSGKSDASDADNDGSDDHDEDDDHNKAAEKGGKTKTHGDGKNHESGAGKEQPAKKGETKNKDSDAETRDGENGEPDDSTRADEDDDDIALRFSMIKLRSRDDIRP